MPTKKTLGEPDAGNPQVRFDEGALETEPWPKRGTGMLRKQPETATPRSYSHRASALLHRCGEPTRAVPYAGKGTSLRRSSSHSARDAQWRLVRIVSVGACCRRSLDL